MFRNTPSHPPVLLFLFLYFELLSIAANSHKYHEAQKMTEYKYIKKMLLEEEDDDHLRTDILKRSI